MIAFADREQSQKGYFAEAIVENWLSSKGYNVYTPSRQDRAHPFDMLCINSERIFVADSKAKAKRKYYPDTGIDVRHYKKYCETRDKLHADAFLFFVDEEAGQIYGNFLRELEKPATATAKGKILNYPLIERDWRGVETIYFHISKMIKVCDLTPEQVRELKSKTTKQDFYR